MSDADSNSRIAYHYRLLIAGLAPLQKLMLDLDTVLTGNAPTEVVRQYHHYPDTLEKWLQEPGGNPVWYLSDSGYSRVVWSVEDGNVFLTYNSTSRVKDRWESAQPQRKALEDYLKAEYQRLSGRESRAGRVVATLLETAETVVAQPPMVLETRHPKMKALKDNRVELDDAERKEVMRRGAVWHKSPGGKASPAVWKSEIRGKTYYVCNTHRAMQVKPTLKGAIRAFDFIATTA